MGYRVVYGLEPVKKKGRVVQLTILSFLAFLLLVNSLWPRGREVLQKVLWPGDWQKTRQAAESFVRELRYGETFSDAAEGFLRELIYAG